MSSAETLRRPSQELARPEPGAPSVTAVEGGAVLWRPGETFHPERIDEVVQTEGKPIDDPAYGKGILWALRAGPVTPTRLALFPASKPRLAKIYFLGASTEPQSREYVVDSISLQAPQGETSLVICFERGIRRSAIVLHASGEVDESHRFVKVPGQPPPTEGVVWSAQNIVVPASPDGLLQRPTIPISKAARIMRCEPANVRKLLRSGRLLGVKLGGQWYVDSEAAHAYTRTKRGLWRKEAVSTTAGTR